MAYSKYTPPSQDRINLNKLTGYVKSLVYKGHDANVLVAHLRDSGISEHDLAVVLKKSRQAIHKMYPKTKTTAETVAFKKGEV